MCNDVYLLMTIAKYFPVKINYFLHKIFFPPPKTKQLVISIGNKPAPLDNQKNYQHYNKKLNNFQFL